MERIYLDYAATAPMSQKTIEAYSKGMQQYFGNASSIYTSGRDAQYELMQVRSVLAKSIGAEQDDIIFTSGGTESDNTAILKVAESYKANGRHIITTAVEHKAVLEPMQYLEQQGFTVTYLPVNEYGHVTAEQVAKALTDETILVSIMYGNNETGAINPIEAIGQILAEHQAIFHTDAVQAYGTQMLDVNQLGVDLLSVSAHKIGGPKGMGFLYARPHLKGIRLLLGGNQELKRRAGTQNVPGAIAFKQAVLAHAPVKQSKQYRKLMAYFLEQLNENGVSFSINGASDIQQSLPHICNLQFPGILAEKLLIQLDLMGVEVAAGSACTAGNTDPSHVLIAMFGEDSPQVTESLRFSIGAQTTIAQLEQVAVKVKQAIEKLRK